MKYLIEDTKKFFNFDVEVNSSELTSVVVTTVWLLNSTAVNKDIEETLKDIHSELEALKLLDLPLNNAKDVYFASKSLHKFVLNGGVNKVEKMIDEEKNHETEKTN